VNHFVHSVSPRQCDARLTHALAADPETLEKMRTVNVDAGFHLSRELARQLIAAKTPGSFLLLTSLHAGTPRNLPNYSTSKAALSMLVEELAKTLGRFDIRINALVPRAVAAGGFVADSYLARHIPPGRLGRAEDLAPLALDVLSKPNICLRHRSCLRGRRRSVSDELVRPAGFGCVVTDHHVPQKCLRVGAAQRAMALPGTFRQRGHSDKSSGKRANSSPTVLISSVVSRSARTIA
jgi:hypothetical protein